MAAPFDDFRRDVFFSTDEGVGTEVRDTGFRVYGGELVCVRAVATTEDHGGLSAGVGLLAEVEVGEHYVAGLMEEDV